MYLECAVNLLKYFICNNRKEGKKNLIFQKRSEQQKFAMFAREKNVFAFIAFAIKFEAIKVDEKKSHIILESYGAISRRMESRKKLFQKLRPIKFAMKSVKTFHEITMTHFFALSFEYFIRESEVCPFTVLRFSCHKGELAIVQVFLFRRKLNELFELTILVSFYSRSRFAVINKIFISSFSQKIHWV